MMDSVLRKNIEEEIHRLLGQLSDSKLAVVTEILKGIQNDRYSGLSDKKRDAITELVNLVRPVLNVDIDGIREIITPIAERHELKRVFLFGSRARGDNRPDSDYDFIVSFGSNKGLFEYVDLVEELEDAFVAHVDVITDSSDCNDPIFVAAEKEKVLIYDRT